VSGDGKTAEYYCASDQTVAAVLKWEQYDKTDRTVKGATEKVKILRNAWLEFMLDPTEFVDYMLKVRHAAHKPLIFLLSTVYSLCTCLSVNEALVAGTCQEALSITHGVQRQRQLDRFEDASASTRGKRFLVSVPSVQACSASNTTFSRR
jgi:hypothetical protein